MLKKIVVISAVIIIIFAAAWGLSFYFIDQYVQTHQSEIQSQIKQKIPYPIQFQDLHTKLGLIGPYLSIDNIQVMDKVGEENPFLTIQHLKLHPHLIRSILKKNFEIKRVVLDNPKIELDWNTQAQKFQIKNFNSEQISPSETIMGAASLFSLKLPFDVILKSAEITWVGSFSILQQKISGTLESGFLNENLIKFSGRQALKVNEGSFFPESVLNVWVNVQKKTAGLETGFNGALLNCSFEAEEQVTSEKLGTSKQKIASEYPIECKAKFKDFDLEFLHENAKLKEKDIAWLRWLTTSLQTGYLNGNMALSQTGLSGNLDFQNMKLQYSPQWPAIDSMNGNIKIEGDAIFVQTNEGDIMGMPVETVNAKISPISKNQYPIVTVIGQVKGRLEQALAFLKETPLQKTVYPSLETLSPEGDMFLKLDLHIPLNNLQAKVNGSVEVEDGTLNIKDFNLNLEDLNGIFDFNNQGVNNAKAKAKFEGNDVNISATPDYISADTKLSIELLKKQFSWPFLDFFRGETEVNVKRMQKDASIVIESDLLGIESILPPPLNKDPNTKLPFTFTDQREGTQFYYSFNAKDMLDGKLDFTSQNGELKLRSGQIILGGKNAAWVNQSVLLIGGTLKTLDVNEWKPFITTKSNITNIPVNINLYVDQLKAFGFNFPKIEVSHESRFTNTWNLDSPAIKGLVSLPYGSENNFIFNLDRLKISGDISQHPMQSQMLSPDNKMNILFQARDLTFGGKSFGDVAFNLKPNENGYRIEKISIKNSDYLFEANGEWNLKPDQINTQLKGQILSENLAKVFSQMGLTSSFEDGQGRLQFDLQWPDSPFGFSLKTAEGIAYLQMKSGHIQGVNAGLGKIIGLLNIDTIKRRLQLDFSDLVKEGFVFDTLDGSFKFQKGLAVTNDFLVDGPAAKIELAGNANLESKQLNLNMTVVPKAVSSSLPIAAGLASGNPAVGLGVWALDKITGSRISNITQHQYRVTGTWDAPHIEEMGANNNQ